MTYITIKKTSAFGKSTSFLPVEEIYNGYKQREYEKSFLFGTKFNPLSLEEWLRESNLTKKSSPE